MVTVNDAAKPLLHVISILVLLWGMVFLMSNITTTAIFFILASVIVNPFFERIYELGDDNRFLAMSILMVIGICFMPSPYGDIPFF